MKIAESVAAEYKINTIYDIPTYAERLKIDNFLKVVKEKVMATKVVKAIADFKATKWTTSLKKHLFEGEIVNGVFS
jgi:hypothetical protein